MAVATPAGDANTVTEVLLENIDANINTLASTGIAVTAGDIQIGAVEIKNATTDVRAVVAADGRLAVDGNLQVGDTDHVGNTGTVGATTLRVTLATNVALPAGEAFLGIVAEGSPIAISPTITGSDTPDYTSGDVLGAELTLTDACRTAAGYTRLDSVVIRNDAPGVAITGDIIIFNADPAGTFTDNGACPDLTADIAKIVGRVPIASGDWVTAGSIGIAHITVNKVMKSAATANLWAVIVVTSAVNLAATTDVSATFNFVRY